MRVGFITPIVWERYGPVWAQMIAGVGAEPVSPEPARVLEAASSLASDQGTLALLARASLRALRDVDLVLVPKLLPDSQAATGAAQDPWVADLPEMLERFESARAPLVAVPCETGPSVEPQVIEVLTRVQRDVGLVRRAWDRHRVAASRPWSPRSVGRGTVGDRSARNVALAGMPWWCNEPVARLLRREGEVLSGQHQVDPAVLRDEGRRWRSGLSDVDAEALGAVRRFGRRADVDAVRLVVDAASQAEAWLARRAAELAPDRLEVVALGDALDLETLVQALVPADLLPAGS